MAADFQLKVLLGMVVFLSGIALTPGQISFLFDTIRGGQIWVSLIIKQQ